jgi:hypothetical protein
MCNAWSRLHQDQELPCVTPGYRYIMVGLVTIRDENDKFVVNSGDAIGGV